MKRDIQKKLISWKQEKSHKPLILNGARYVGKTYALQQFGKSQYEKMAYSSPPDLKGLRLSMLPYQDQEWM